MVECGLFKLRRFERNLMVFLLEDKILGGLFEGFVCLETGRKSRVQKTSLFLPVLLSSNYGEIQGFLYFRKEKSTFLNVLFAKEELIALVLQVKHGGGNPRMDI